MNIGASAISTTTGDFSALAATFRALLLLAAWTVLTIQGATESLAGTPTKGGPEAVAREQLLETLIAGRRQLIEDDMAAREKLRGAKQGVRKKAIQALWEKNRGKREALQEQAQVLAESQPPRRRTFIEEVVPRPDTTPEMEAFLVVRAEAQNDYIELENSLIGTTPEARAQAYRAFAEQSLAKRHEMAVIGSKVAKQAATALLPLPPEPHRTHASSELKAFLEERKARMREGHTFEEHLRNLPPEQQVAARRAWQRQQAPKRAALAAKAKRLAEKAP